MHQFMFDLTHDTAEHFALCFDSHNASFTGTFDVRCSNSLDCVLVHVSKNERK